MEHEELARTLRYLKSFGFNVVDITFDYSRHWKSLESASNYATYLAAAE